MQHIQHQQQTHEFKDLGAATPATYVQRDLQQDARPCADLLHVAPERCRTGAHCCNESLDIFGRTLIARRSRV